MALAKPLNSLVIIFIPCFIILAVASASVFEVKLCLGSATRGEITALIQDLQKLTVGAMALRARRLCMQRCTFCLLTTFSQS